MEIKKHAILFTLLSVLLLGSTEAQELFYRKNLANIDVQQLSQQDINRFSSRVSQANMSEAEVMSYLMQKGLSRSEIASLLQKMDQKSLTTGRSINKDLSRMLDEELENSDPMIDRLYLKSEIPPDSLIFGSELFSNLRLDFAPNLQLATPVNYMLGPGDKVNIALFGSQETIEEFEINPNGKINFPFAGVIQIAGLTVEQAEARLKAVLAERGYSSINEGETRLNLSILEYRTIPITVIGARQSGNYTLPSVASAFHALFTAGGPHRRGSFRSIEVIRRGRIIQTIDLYKFLVYGDRSMDVVLEENDVINIPVYDRMVRVRGEVKRPGFFELLEGESMHTLLTYTGGFTPIAYKENVYVQQIGENEFLSKDLNANEFEAYFPGSGDVITVGSIASEYQQRVSINGAVKRPGKYGWHEDLLLSALVERAGGFTESALMTRAILYRSPRDNSSHYLRFVPEDLLAGKENFRLMDGDSVVIGDRREMFPHEKIQVVGEVNKADEFPYGEGMTALDAILLAGGMKISAIANSIEVARKVDGNDELVIARLIKADSDAELIVQADEVLLEPRDIVIVKPRPDYRENQIVTVEGEVVSPGSYPLLNQNERLSSLLNRAGGLNQLGDENGVLIIRDASTSVVPKDLKSFNLGEKDMAATLDSLLRENASRNVYARTATRDSYYYEDDFDLFSDTRYRDKDRSSNRSLSTNEKPADKDQKKDKKEEKETTLIAINNVRTLLQHPGGKYDLHLKANDRIIVMMRDNTVAVRGSVNNQVSVNYMGSKLRSYLKESGGTLRNAQKNKIFVIEPNGRAKMTRSFLGIKNYPRVSPGSTVVVPKKPEQKGRLSDPATMAALASILASATSFVFMISTLK
ncbi:MAG: SLBB domain-containing protein [Bacteroidales bacterium]|jgi:protein involved in polysaccharide export with SLBB domain|nr:SLBB domain-containing protein [Bacteroidales bacterium]